MNTESKTRLVLASVLAGISTMVNITPLKAMPAEIQGASPAREIAVSQAALNAIDARVRQAAINRAPSQERFYQIIRGPFVESGPEFVQSWNGQMRLP